MKTWCTGLLAAHRDLARAHEQRVAGAHVDLVLGHRLVEILRGDGVTRLEPVDALHARNIEEDAAGDDVPAHLLDTVLLRPQASDEVGVVAVVELAVEEAVRERVPLYFRQASWTMSAITEPPYDFALNIGVSRPSALLPMASSMRSTVGGMSVDVRTSRSARSAG